MPTILHLDLDAFFCAVEEQRDPTLRGTAFAVGGRPAGRGVVASCSYAARRFGVHSAMPMARAVRECPHLVIVPPDFAAYRAASREVMRRLAALTPLVEAISIDEAFLDVTGLPGAGEPLARQLQAQINAELGLPCSLGVAANKLVAKIANNIGKGAARGDTPPNAITVVTPGTEAAFLAPLPIRELWGVGAASAARLRERGVHTIGDLARLDPRALRLLFGKHGDDLSRRARGIDPRPVEPERETKSISKEITFARDVRDGAHLRRVVRALSESVGFRLRKAGLTATTIRLKLRWSDFTTITRQTTLAHPTDSDAHLRAAALATFDAAYTDGLPVRLVGVGVAGLSAAGEQLSLWSAPSDPTARRLQDTLDDLRGRFGEGVIRRASDPDSRHDDD